MPKCPNCNFDLGEEILELEWSEIFMGNDQERKCSKCGKILVYSIEWEWIIKCH